MNQILLRLLFSLGCLAVYSYTLGLYSLFKFPYILIGMIPCLYYGIRLAWNIVHSHPSPGEKLILSLIGFQLFIASWGIFMPEIGFDALWYHLPEAQVYSTTGKIARIPELLYSTMPRLGEMYFAIAFLFSHSLILIKIVCFFFSILFTLLSYSLSRLFLSRLSSIIIALIVNSLYLVSWQATSAYVDLPAAVFTLASLYCLLKYFADKPINRLTDYRLLISSPLFLGLALSVKFQAVIYLLATLIVLLIKTKKFLLATYYILITIMVVSPWLLDNYLQSGHPFYPLNLISKQADQISFAGSSSILNWLLDRLLHLPLLFYQLSITPRDLLTPLILILLPILIFQFKLLIHHRLTLLAIGYTLTTLVLWWFLPPPETRYVLAAIPPLIILEIWSVVHLPAKFNSVKSWTVIFIFLIVGLNLALRFGAEKKYLPVLLGRQTSAQYLITQTTDFNRSIVEKFYSNYWFHYQYP
jgi:4-amino-4-deoxy-L-arabinose transferase-like glycosyltransferase